MSGQPKLTLQSLKEAAEAEGWHVQYTTNVHLDRADWPAGTGHVLVECFDENGNPGYAAAGSEHENEVCIAGDKLSDRPFASTVEGVLEWARYSWDSPDDPLPDVILTPKPVGIPPDVPTYAAEVYFSSPAGVSEEALVELGQALMAQLEDFDHPQVTIRRIDR